MSESERLPEKRSTVGNYAGIESPDIEECLLAALSKRSTRTDTRAWTVNLGNVEEVTICLNAQDMRTLCLTATQVVEKQFLKELNAQSPGNKPKETKLLHLLDCVVGVDPVHRVGMSYPLQSFPRRVTVSDFVGSSFRQEDVLDQVPSIKVPSGYVHRVFADSFPFTHQDALLLEADLGGALFQDVVVHQADVKSGQRFRGRRLTTAIQVAEELGAPDKMLSAEELMAMRVQGMVWDRIRDNVSHMINMFVRLRGGFDISGDPNVFNSRAALYIRRRHGHVGHYTMLYEEWWVAVRVLQAGTAAVNFRPCHKYPNRCTPGQGNYACRYETFFGEQSIFKLFEQQTKMDKVLVNITRAVTEGGSNAVKVLESRYRVAKARRSENHSGTFFDDLISQAYKLVYLYDEMNPNPHKDTKRYAAKGPEESPFDVQRQQRKDVMDWFSRGQALRENARRVTCQWQEGTIFRIRQIGQKWNAFGKMLEKFTQCQDSLDQRFQSWMILDRSLCANLGFHRRVSDAVRVLEGPMSNIVLKYEFSFQMLANHVSTLEMIVDCEYVWASGAFVDPLYNDILKYFEVAILSVGQCACRILEIELATTGTAADNVEWEIPPPIWVASQDMDAVLHRIHEDSDVGKMFHNVPEVLEIFSPSPSFLENWKCKDLNANVATIWDKERTLPIRYPIHVADVHTSRTKSVSIQALTDVMLRLWGVCKPHSFLYRRMGVWADAKKVGSYTWLNRGNANAVLAQALNERWKKWEEQSAARQAEMLRLAQEALSIFRLCLRSRGEGRRSISNDERRELLEAHELIVRKAPGTMEEWERAVEEAVRMVNQK